MSLLGPELPTGAMQQSRQQSQINVFVKVSRASGEKRRRAKQRPLLLAAP
jgi:hypothetical protein